MLRRIAAATLATALSGAGAGAQTSTLDHGVFFHADVDATRHDLRAGEPRWSGPDAEYDAVAPTEGQTVGPVLVDPASAVGADELRQPDSLGFDASALRNLPFGLTRADDPALLYFLRYYATEGRRRMSNWLARSGMYRDMVEPLLVEAEVPVELFWVVAVESDFDPAAESHAGAVGLWQFMARTARAYELRVDRQVDERRAAEAATRAAAAYFTDLYETFGSWPLALAAYNAGHGHVRGELRDGNLTDFWELEDYQAIFSDARRYALRVMTIAIVDRNREAFGYTSVVPDEPLAYDVVEVPGNVRLSLLGEAVGLNAAELLELNPSLIGLRTPSDADSYPLNIPTGTTDTFVRSFDRLRARYGEDHELVQLRFGETVGDVADACDLPERVLRSINDIAYDAPSPYGSEILVPAGRCAEPAPAEERTRVIVPQTRFEFADRTRVFYRTRPGDTLNGVAEHFELEPQHVAAWNDLDADAALVSGLFLQLYVSPSLDLSATVHLSETEVDVLALNSPEWIAAREADEAAAAARRRFYTVRSGDTVMGLAERFGVRTADIVRWNGLGEEAMIFVGQRLVVGR